MDHSVTTPTHQRQALAWFRLINQISISPPSSPSLSPIHSYWFVRLQWGWADVKRIYCKHLGHLDTTPPPPWVPPLPPSSSKDSTFPNHMPRSSGDTSPPPPPPREYSHQHLPAGTLRPQLAGSVLCICRGPMLCIPTSLYSL